MSTIFRLYIEKKSGFDIEASNLFSEITDFLQIKSLKKLRMLYRYDIEGITTEEYKIARNTVFADPPQDNIYDEAYPALDDETVFAIEYLPGQYDQRSDSAAQCIQILSHKEAPLVRSAKVVILYGKISTEQLNRIKKHCINPVDSRLAELGKPGSLVQKISEPKPVKILNGFRDYNKQELSELSHSLGLAMADEDLLFCREYFKNDEQRDPTITEIKMLDTYWSDHCRHTTFQAVIESVKIEKSKYSEIIENTYNKYLSARRFVYGENNRNDCLMDLATIAMKELRKSGKLKELDVSEEINACSIKIPVEVDGKTEDWLIMFKNETHNHPTEIEPFGGAATCLGGAIRDPLSGRAYVYQAMRVTGSGDPRADVNKTIPGKLPQRTITTMAAKGYCSYGNQIGLATGQVSEIYDEGYVAKRMEIGAVIGAVPAKNVKRQKPENGDVVILVGGRTGRDGIGGATGSSKAHTEKALQNEAEVQKGNPPVERKLQRLFTDKEVTGIIKRCNDFGAGGVSVAIGELAPSLDIDLDSVPKKYDGLDGTELALSESQERMAVVIEAGNVDLFKKKAFNENLEATQVARITDNGRLRMFWKGNKIVDLKRSFLDTNGVLQKSNVNIQAPSETGFFYSSESKTDKDLKSRWLKVLSDKNVAMQKGLVEQFDSTIGARTVLHPYGGVMLRTPSDSMVSRLPFVKSDTATAMSWGFDPQISKWSPFHGAVYSVLDSVARLVAVGADYRKIYLTFQEYFEKLENDPEKWGKPYAALLGAYHAQSALQIAAIGGKDSMSGTFNELNVPPTLVSFAVAPLSAQKTISAEFKQPGHKVILICCKRDKHDLPDFELVKKNYDLIFQYADQQKIFAAAVVKNGGLAAAISKMSFGNNIGFIFNDAQTVDFFAADYGSILLEVEEETANEIQKISTDFILLGTTTNQPEIIIADTKISIHEAFKTWSGVFENIFPTKHEEKKISLNALQNNIERPVSINLGKKPKVFIPVFPGTNCEYDSEQAFTKAGAEVEIGVLNNLSPNALNDSLRYFADQIKSSQIVLFPGGFSAGDEPEGSGKFIAAVIRNHIISDALMDLLKKRDGLVLGICNGFQALVKTGLVPYGEIRAIDADLSPTLTFNKLKRHYSNMVRTKVVSTLSPWFLEANTGDVHIIPISNGEGRFVASEELIHRLHLKGQIATQYVDLDNQPSMQSEYNPSGSMYAIEAVSSPDGRVLGKMAHSERIGINVSKNVPGNKDQKLFESGVKYFK